MRLTLLAATALLLLLIHVPVGQADPGGVELGSWCDFRSDLVYQADNRIGVFGGQVWCTHEGMDAPERGTHYNGVILESLPDPVEVDCIVQKLLDQAPLEIQMCLNP